MNVLDHLQYTEEHEWLRKEGNLFVIGITDHAQASLGDIVFVEPPQKAKQIKRGDVVATIESVKAVSEVYAPISGEVIEVNQALTGSAEIINRAPYSEGWLFKMNASDIDSEKDTLLSPQTYKDYLSTL